MRRVFRLNGMLALAVCLIGVFLWQCRVHETLAARQESDEEQQRAVAQVVASFGQRLKMVSLLAPSEIVEKTMREQYGDLVTSGLIEAWSKDPLNAPGRRVSSPWPDRIEISSITRVSAQTLKVDGEIIEVTSVEKEKGGAAARQDVAILLEKSGNRWLITSVNMGGYKGLQGIMYDNVQYGFTFSLPPSWQGYSIVTSTWNGTAIDGPSAGKVVESGPVIMIRHPGWTAENPRQDIPIMVLTLSQWDGLQAMEFNVGAAPIGPTKLGENSKFVFALPARYNYAFRTGFEEVQAILDSKPLRTYEATK